MKKKLKSVLKEVLDEINPKEEDLDYMGDSLKEFLFKINSRIKKFKIDADVFVGGSFAKGTLIKKDFYDIDLFLRFGKKHSEENFKTLIKKILRFIGKVSLIHGSRDYFKIRGNSFFFFELVPVKRIRNPREARNITDLSYSHVNYIKKKVKNKNILDEIKLAKAFCYATKTYGAESYVRGFSGYALELLIYYYGSFEKFLRELSKKREGKLVIDIEKDYRKGNVLLDINSSKLDSPVILIDPTFKTRNVLAALSEETFRIFQKNARGFLKNPSKNYFRRKKINFEKNEDGAKKRNLEFLRIKINTKRERGDVAGAKLLKFFNFLGFELKKYFDIKKKDFEYEVNDFGEGYFILKKKEKIIYKGPKLEDKKNVLKFKEKHKRTFSDKKRIYSEKKINFSARKFLENWTKNNKRKIREMSIKKIEINS